MLIPSEPWLGSAVWSIWQARTWPRHRAPNVGTHLGPKLATQGVDLGSAKPSFLQCSHLFFHLANPLFLVLLGGVRSPTSY